MWLKLPAPDSPVDNVPFAEILEVMHKKNKTKKPGNVISALYHLIVLLVFLNSVSF